MVKVIFNTPSGERVETEAPAGESAMRAAINADVEGIDADCGGVCSCATCLVLVVGDWLKVTGGPGETEREMIEFEGEPEENSRLSCQITLTDEMDGLELTVVPR